MDGMAQISNGKAPGGAELDSGNSPLDPSF